MLEDLLKAAVLGVVQGLTEFLPVSSTGHLVLVEKVLHVDEDRYGLSFDASLHLGTLVALLWFFGRTWLDLAAGGLRSLRDRSLADPQGKLAWLIVLGTVPAAVIGALFQNAIEDAFREPWLIAAMLIAFSAVFVAAERLSAQRRGVPDLGWRDALWVGAFQAMALVPGTSRSGATISAGLFANVQRREAAQFAFLLSAPVIAGAGLARFASVIADFADGTLGGVDLAFFATGFICAAVVGYAAIALLLRFLETNSLTWFVVYRVALGVFVLAVVVVR